ncbi:hypothetical protein BIV57_07885 [Mangrovactinospora gilvigrisea]|uniref:Uncharacterized protein n=1 Tax=Mangrovactinospora gilvigrisea TaxID=1428644 RepID=A0A1J7CEC0_9ACTN|nr:hypothetical protein [Mangrovactinospora gilvigrisea]OIV38026.1 hypothetical protein BIV57_07885 [Mangrovactinospora gilvigrisea]
MSNKVESPMWRALDDLYNDVSAHQTTVAQALKAADKQMDSGKGDVWMGPVARSWGSDLHGHSAGLGSQTSAFLDAVLKERNSLDKEVTPQQAHMEQLQLSGRI